MRGAEKEGPPMTTCLYTERAEAERGIERYDGLIREACEPRSPIAVYLDRYIKQRRAYALTAAWHAARIARLEQGL
jgi:hypothetical protein